MKKPKDKLNACSHIFFDPTEIVKMDNTDHVYINEEIYEILNESSDESSDEILNEDLDENPGNTAYIYEVAPGTFCIDIIGETNEIPDETLDDLLQNYNDYFAINVLYNNGEEECSFYDAMADHSRLEEFIKADAAYIFHKRFNTDPVLGEKFKKAIIEEVCKEKGLPSDLIEEFLHFANNRKSARNTTIQDE